MYFYLLSIGGFTLGLVCLACNCVTVIFAANQSATIDKENDIKLIPICFPESYLISNCIE